jgi:transposase InsO family protein
MDKLQKTRLDWIKLYQEVKDAGIVCRRCGISRPTLRKWLKRYAEEGIAGLKELSRKPHSSPKKVSDQQEKLLLSIRNERKLGVRRVQSEIKRLYDISLSLATIHKIFKKNNIPYLQKKRHYRKQAKRYNCRLPGERVQMDVCKIASSLYQYTAIDDCTRYKVLTLYKRRTAINTLDFLEQVMERMPFPIQRIQTDRGQEFFAYEVQERLMEYGIKFRPIKPASPHLNGKVERTQRTDLDEFYSSIDIKSPKLKEELGYWEHYYNWDRPHSSLGGKTPNEKYVELIYQTPLHEEVNKKYDPSKEHILIHSYNKNLATKILKYTIKHTN